MNQAIEALTRANTAHFHALNALEAAKAERDALIQQVATEAGDATDKRISKADTAIAQASTAAELADAAKVTAQREYYVAQAVDLARQRDAILEKHRGAGERITEARQRIVSV